MMLGASVFEKSVETKEKPWFLPDAEPRQSRYGKRAGVAELTDAQDSK